MIVAGSQVMSKRKLTKIRADAKNPKAATGMIVDSPVARKAIPVVKVVAAMVFTALL
jgi:hypothetical protein